MKLIGLKGRLHSGKDTALKFIEDAAAPKRVQRVAFADKLKLSGVRALGYDPDSVETAVELANNIKENCDILVVDNGRDAVEERITGRTFWQRYGTEAHRDVFASDFWVDALLPLPPQSLLNEPEFDSDRWLAHQFPDADVVVVTDLRFPNEASRVRALGGEVWEIDAERRLGPLPAGSHVSEQPLLRDLIDAVIPNNDTLEQFEEAVKAEWGLYRC